MVPSGILQYFYWDVELHSPLVLMGQKAEDNVIFLFV